MGLGRVISAGEHQMLILKGSPACSLANPDLSGHLGAVTKCRLLLKCKLAQRNWPRYEHCPNALFRPVGIAYIPR